MSIAPCIAPSIGVPPVLQAIAPLFCSTGGTLMEGAVQGALETLFRPILLQYDRCSELILCTKIMMGK
jgi:hypothetical protein